MILSETVVLVGMMGAGKSSVGRRLARKADVPFRDADGEIEEAAGCTIAEIFARDGEAAFREGERDVVRRLLDGPVGVVATGGGAFGDAATRGTISARAVSVWIRADLDLLWERVSRRSNRPLLRTADPRRTLAELVEARAPIYALADITVDSGPGPVEETVERVLAALERTGVLVAGGERGCR